MNVVLTKHKQTTFNEHMNTARVRLTLDQRRESCPHGARGHDSPSGRIRRLRRAGSAVAAPLAAVAALRLLYGAALHTWPPGGLTGSSTVDEVVLGLLAWTAVALCAWLALGVTLSTLTRIPGRLGRWVEVLADRVTPAVVRRSLAMLLGVSVSTVALPTGTASGAVTSLGGTGSSVDRSVGWTVTDAGAGRRGARLVAEPSPGFLPSRSVTQKASPTVTDSSISTSTSSTHAEADGPGFEVTDDHDHRQGNHQSNQQSNQQSNHQGIRPDAQAPGPGWRPTVPVRTTGGPPTLLTPAPRTSAAPIAHVTVRRGDSLWSIVARHLGPGTSDTEIAHEWPRWFEANAAVIGDDPDLILPGQQLVPPLAGAHP